MVRHRAFKQGDLVFVLLRPITVTHCTKGKFEPECDGPYVIEKVYDGGAYQLINHKENKPMPLINGRGSSSAIFSKQS